MTVTAKTTRIQYTGTGLVKTYAYGWKILTDADLVVISTTPAGVDTTLTLTTDYTVTGAGSDSGGNVVLADNLASGYLLTIYLDMDIEQPTDLTNQQSPFLERIEAALDRTILVSQQLATKLGLCVQFPASSTEDPTTIVAVVNQAVADAQTAQTGAETAQGLAEDARDDAVIAQTAAEAAQSAAEAAAQNISVQRFTATASAAQTVITPGFTWDDGAGNIVVYIDGLKQAVGTYTLASPTITLSEALDGGETIEVYSVDFTAAPGDPLYPADIGSTVQAYDADTAKLDVAQEWTKPQRPKPVAVNITSAFDASANAAVKRTLAGNETVAAPSNTPVEGDELYFYVTGASTYTLSWDATYKAKSGGTLPSAPAAGKVLSVAFRYDGTNWQHIGDRTDA